MPYLQDNGTGEFNFERHKNKSRDLLHFSMVSNTRTPQVYWAL